MQEVSHVQGNKNTNSCWFKMKSIYNPQIYIYLFVHDIKQNSFCEEKHKLRNTDVHTKTLIRKMLASRFPKEICFSHCIPYQKLFVLICFYVGSETMVTRYFKNLTTGKWYDDTCHRHVFTPGLLLLCALKHPKKFISMDGPTEDQLSNKHQWKGERKTS